MMRNALTRLRNIAAILGMAAIGVAGCSGLNVDEAGGVTTKADEAADKYWVPADTVEERRARAWSAAAVLSQVVREKVRREPEKAAQAAGSLEAMGATLKSGLNEDWPAFSLYRIRVSMYRALFTGARGRVTDYVGLSFSPLNVIDEIQGITDIGSALYMREDVICHFGSLTKANKKVKKQCEIDGVMDKERKPEDLVKLYKQRFQDNLSFVKSTLRE